MTDRQKTVEELGFVREHFLYQVEEADQQHKQYYIRLGNIVLDAINLLKEQEAKPVKVVEKRKERSKTELKV